MALGISTRWKALSQRKLRVINWVNCWEPKAMQDSKAKAISSQAANVRELIPQGCGRFRDYGNSESDDARTSAQHPSRKVGEDIVPASVETRSEV